MVVAGFNYIYGVKVNKEDLLKLHKEGVVIYDGNLEEDAKEGKDGKDGEDEIEEGLFLANDNRYDTVQVPHEARWTDFEDNAVYFGINKHVAFDSHDKNPLDKLAFSVDELVELHEMINEILPGKTFQYHMIPDDCNCCS